LLAAGAVVDFQDEYGRTPLTSASAAGFSDVVKALLAAGANVNEQSPLLYALGENRMDVARILIEAKADVHAVLDRGDTTLMLAASRGQLDLVQTFLNAGVGVNAANKGILTPLMYAAEAGHIDVLNALLAAGADVNAVRYDGSIPRGKRWSSEYGEGPCSCKCRYQHQSNTRWYDGVKNCRTERSSGSRTILAILTAMATVQLVAGVCHKSPSLLLAP
jgi:ankyrin repeat protein